LIENEDQLHAQFRVVACRCCVADCGGFHRAAERLNLT
jgi:DNA-binding transcriptional LysR family regulator